MAKLQMTAHFSSRHSSHLYTLPRVVSGLKVQVKPSWRHLQHALPASICAFVACALRSHSGGLCVLRVGNACQYQ